MSERTEQLLDEIVGLLALTIRQGAENQTEANRLFTQADLEPYRVAPLLGTTPATVRATRAKAK